MELLCLFLEIVIYVLYLSGLVLAFGNIPAVLYRRLQLRRRLRKRHKRAGYRPHIQRYVHNLFLAAFGGAKRSRTAAISIMGIALILSVLSLKNLGVSASISIGISSLLLPLVLLRLRLGIHQNKGSREGISLVSELYRQYRISGRNIYEAMETVSSSDIDAPICKRHLSALLFRLRSASAPSESGEHISSFVFALGTAWGKSLGLCIALSAEKGVDVSEGLSDILHLLKEAKDAEENRKRLNDEAIRMTLVFIPFLYIATLWLSVSFMGIPLNKLLYNQFSTREGFMLFMATCFLFCLNLGLLEALRNVRLDI